MKGRCLLIEALKKSPWLHLLLLVGVGIAVYANTLGNAFNVDDAALLLNNPAVHGLTWENIVLMFSSVPNGLEYLPVRDLTYAIDHTFWGLSPVGYHAANLLYYLLTSCAFYLLLRRLLPLLGAPEPLVALIATSLFVVHPVHVESVAGIAQRKDLVSGVLFIASIYAYVSFRERGRWTYYAGSCGLYLLALLAKSTVIILPLLLAGLEFFWLDRPQAPPRSDLPVERNGADPPRGRGVLPLAPLKAMALALPYLGMSIAYYLVQASILIQADVLSNSSFFAGLDVRFNTALRAVMFYLGKLLVPYPLNLVHPFAKSSSMVDLGGIIGLLIVIVMVWLLCRCYARFRATALGAYWLLVCLLPVVGILPTNTPYIVAERYLFLSSMGFCLLVVQAGWLFAERFRNSWRLLVAAYLVVALAFAALAFTRNRDWQDSITLLEKNVAAFPATMDPGYAALRNYLVTILGMEYYTAQRDAETAATFARLKAMNPALGIYADLFAAIRFYEQQNLAQALHQLDAITISDKSEIYEINYLYGNLYAALGATEKGRASYRLALENQRSLGFLTVNKAEVAELLRRLPPMSP